MRIFDSVLNFMLRTMYSYLIYHQRDYLDNASVRFDEMSHAYDIEKLFFVIAFF